MSPVLNLPTDYFTELLTNWCESNHLAKLDTAVCNSQYRQILLNIFGNVNSVFSFTDTLDRFSSKLLKWIWCRNIKTNFVKVGDIPYVIYILKFQISLKQVHTINIKARTGSCYY